MTSGFVLFDGTHSVGNSKNTQLGILISAS